MARKNINILVFLLLCGSTCFMQTAAAENTQDYSDDLTESINAFTKKLYQTLVVSCESDNLIVSPVSVFSELLMMAMGSHGSTLEENEHALNLTIAGNPSWRKKMSKIQMELTGAKTNGGHAFGDYLFPIRALGLLQPKNNNGEHGIKECPKGESVIVKMDNMILFSENMRVKMEYLNSLFKIFQTQVQWVDFRRPENVRCEVNQRVSDFTNGNIQEIVPADFLSRDTQLVFSNALYFKGRWLKSFKKFETQAKPFHIDVDKSVKVPMMRIKDKFKFSSLEGLDSKAIYLPYENPRYGLLCILPNKVSGLTGTEKSLFGSDYTPAKVLKQMRFTEVDLELPKLKINFHSEMTDTLAKLGISTLSGYADFSNISSSLNSKIEKRIELIHQSTIELTEDGTEAAASTDTIPSTFKANHPFIFYVIDVENDSLPLFVGRLKNPLDP